MNRLSFCGQIFLLPTGRLYCANNSPHCSVFGFCEFRCPKTHDLGQATLSGPYVEGCANSAHERTFFCGVFDLPKASSESPNPYFLRRRKNEGNFGIFPLMYRGTDKKTEENGPLLVLAVRGVPYAADDKERAWT